MYRSLYHREEKALAAGTNGLHLTRRGDVWQFQRRRPKAYADVERRTKIVFSLGTTDYQEARLLAAAHSLQLDRQWSAALKTGISLADEDATARYLAAVETARTLGYDYAAPASLGDGALLDRLRTLLAEPTNLGEQKAVLGVLKQPALSLSQGFDRFWEHIRDEWASFGREQRRVKRNVYLRAIRNFEKAVGEIPLHEIERTQALRFRSWWLKRIETEGLTPYAANREISCLRRLIATLQDIDSLEAPNPFARVRLKDTADRSRSPFETDFIRDRLLASSALDPLPTELQWLVKLLVNTGLRPTEAVGLEINDIDVEAPVPFVHVRANSVRTLKTPHSERQIPLLGVSLTAAQAVVNQGGGGNGRARIPTRRRSSTDISARAVWFRIANKASTACGTGFRTSSLSAMWWTGHRPSSWGTSFTGPNTAMARICSNCARSLLLSPSNESRCVGPTGAPAPFERLCHVRRSP